MAQPCIAVVDAGGYAQAAEALHKSQSSVTYAVQKLQSLLGVKAFEIQGRKAVLTPTGQFLYRRGSALLDEAGGSSSAARALVAQAGRRRSGVVMEIVFPTWLMFKCLDALRRASSPHTRIELIESVLGGTQEALLQGQADLAIGGIVPQGFFGERADAHALRPRGGIRTTRCTSSGASSRCEDLRAHRQLVVRETGSQRARASG